MAFEPSPNPWHTPAAIAMTFFSAAPISTPIGSVLIYSRKVGPLKARWISAANSRSLQAPKHSQRTPRAISLECRAPHGDDPLPPAHPAAHTQHMPLRPPPSAPRAAHIT